MTLIKCGKCGQMISDKASRCPKCGANVNKGLEQQGPIIHKKKNNTLGILIGLLATILFIASIVFSFIHLRKQVFWQNLFSSKEVPSKEIEDINVSDSKEKEQTIFQDENTKIEAEESYKKKYKIENVRNAYLEKIKEMQKEFIARNEEDENRWYFLLDITHDGTPELWINTGHFEANCLDRKFCVYTYEDNGLINLGEDWWGNNSCFYAGSDYVICVNAHMDDASWFKYTYSGKKLKIETIYEEHISGDEEYREPKEKQIELIPFYDTASIEHMYVN